MLFADNLCKHFNPDQAKQIASLDVGPNCLYTDDIPGRKLKTVNFEKKNQTIKNHAKSPSMQRVKIFKNYNK